MSSPLCRQRAAAPLTVRACPLCAEAIADSNGSDDEEINNFPAAMNQSIYLMISVPYLALGIVGVCIYRGVKKNDDYRDGSHIAQFTSFPNSVWERLSEKRCFSVELNKTRDFRGRETEFPGRAFPNGVWERGIPGL